MSLHFVWGHLSKKQTVVSCNWNRKASRHLLLYFIMGGNIFWSQLKVNISLPTSSKGACITTYFDERISVSTILSVLQTDFCANPRGSIKNNQGYSSTIFFRNFHKDSFLNNKNSYTVLLKDN